MKIIFSFFFIFLISLPQSTQAKIQKRRSKMKILQCLGKEEETLHKKGLQGLFYKLNQDMISELILLQDVEVKAKYLKKICSDKHSISYKFFKMMISEGMDLFKFTSTDPMTYRMSKSSTEEMFERLPTIFSRFISRLQSQAPTANCLEKYLPGLESINYQMKYLLTEMDHTKLLKRDKFAKVISRISDVGAIFNQCQKDLQAQLKTKN